MKIKRISDKKMVYVENGTRLTEQPELQELRLLNGPGMWYKGLFYSKHHGGNNYTLYCALTGRMFFKEFNIEIAREHPIMVEWMVNRHLIKYPLIAGVFEQVVKHEPANLVKDYGMVTTVHGTRALQRNAKVIDFGSKKGQYFVNHDGIITLAQNKYIHVDDGNLVKKFDGKIFVLEQMNELGYALDYDSKIDFINNLTEVIIDGSGNRALFNLSTTPHSTVYSESGGVYFLSDEIAEDNGYSYDEEEHDWVRSDEDDQDNFDYHSGGERASFATEKTIFTVGFEIEKEDEVMKKKWKARRVKEVSGWYKERDGSLNSNSGYELVSPVYDLMTDKIMEDIRNKKCLTELVNGGINHNSCGGHLNYGITGHTGQEIFDKVCGYLPLIYALYSKRADNHYCQAKSIDSLKATSEKRQAVRIDGNRIEFRIFSAVRDIKALEWRIGLMRIISKYPNSEPHIPIQMALDSSSELHQHLLKVYSFDRIIEKVVSALAYAKKYEESKYNIFYKVVEPKLAEQQKAAETFKKSQTPVLA